MSFPQPKNFGHKRRIVINTVIHTRELTDERVWKQLECVWKTVICYNSYYQFHQITEIHKTGVY